MDARLPAGWELKAAGTTAIGWQTDQGTGWAWGGDLGTWAFGDLPVSSAVITFRTESGPVLPASSMLESASKQRLVAYPTDRNCRPHSGRPGDLGTASLAGCGEGGGWR